MALRRFNCMRLLQAAVKDTNTTAARAGSTVAYDHNDPKIKIGKREVVGFGYNGGLNYADRRDFPMPAVRFMEDNNEILALRAKEKGDWKKLTIEEKKALYRASFCQTFSELHAPNGDWKFYISGILMAFSGACWMYMTLRTFVMPPIPDSFKPENQKIQLRNLIELQVNPIEGLASKYDYENNRWK